MKYKIITLILILFTQSLYSQNEFRIYVGDSPSGGGTYLKGYGIVRDNKEFGPFSKGSVVTININENKIQRDILEIEYPTHDEIIPTQPIINNEKVLSFEFNKGVDDEFKIDFVFDKKENLITLIKHTYQWDGTESETKEKKFYGFTQQQIHNPKNELEFEYSDYFVPRLLREEFYQKLNNPWKGIRPNSLKRLMCFDREEVEHIIEYYNNTTSLDWDPGIRNHLISRLNHSYQLEVDSIPIELISLFKNYKPTSGVSSLDRDLEVKGLNFSTLENNQKIVLKYDHKGGRISFYPSVNDFKFGRRDKTLFEDISYDYTPSKKKYIIRNGKSYDKYPINSFSVIDTNVVVRTEERVIDTVVWIQPSPIPREFLIVMKEKKQFDQVSKEDYEKKKSNYLKKGYRTYKLYSYKTQEYDFRKVPGIPTTTSGYRDETVVIRKIKSVWLNDIFIGELGVHERIELNELLK